MLGSHFENALLGSTPRATTAAAEARAVARASGLWALRQPTSGQTSPGAHGRPRAQGKRGLLEWDVSRCGFSLVEVAAAFVLLAALLAVTLQIVLMAGEHQRTAWHRRVAMLEAANQMERLAGQPWSALTPEAAATASLSPEAQTLPGAKLAVRIEPAEGEPRAKRITVQVRWWERPGQPEQPVRLVAWKYPIPEQPSGATP